MRIIYYLLVIGSSIVYGSAFPIVGIDQAFAYFIAGKDAVCSVDEVSPPYDEKKGPMRAKYIYLQCGDNRIYVYGRKEMGLDEASWLAIRLDQKFSCWYVPTLIGKDGARSCVRRA